MAKSYISLLPAEAKRWSAIAIAGMISADGVITNSELEILRETLDFLDSMEDINEIVEMVKEKEIPKLPVIKTDRKTASHILLALAEVAISDDQMSNPEAKFFKHIGERLGFDGTFSRKVIQWGMKVISLNRQRKNLLEEAEESVAHYHNF